MKIKDTGHRTETAKFLEEIKGLEIRNQQLEL